MVKPLMLMLLDSWHQRLFSTQVLSRREMKLQVCTLCASVLHKNVILILEKISTVTSFFLEVPLFTRVFQIDLRKNSMPCAHNKTWLRLLLVQIDTTLSGLVVPLFLLSLLSRLNGLPRMSLKRMVLKSFIENAYDQLADLNS